MSKEAAPAQAGSMKVIDKLGFVCVNAHKLLLVARSKDKATFYIPGGKRDPGESDWDALSREIKEELSVKLHKHTVRYVGLFSAPAHGKAAHVQVNVKAYTGQFKGELKPDNEIAELAWLSYADKTRCSVVTQKIMDDLYYKKLLAASLSI